MDSDIIKFNKILLKTLIVGQTITIIQTLPKFGECFFFCRKSYLHIDLLEIFSFLVSFHIINSLVFSILIN